MVHPEIRRCENVDKSAPNAGWMNLQTNLFLIRCLVPKTPKTPFVAGCLKLRSKFRPLTTLVWECNWYLGSLLHPSMGCEHDRLVKPLIPVSFITGWWFGTWLLWLSIFWEYHHPNWRTHSIIFQRGRLAPTNQTLQKYSISWVSHEDFYIRQGYLGVISC